MLWNEKQDLNIHSDLQCWTQEVVICIVKIILQFTQIFFTVSPLEEAHLNQRAKNTTAHKLNKNHSNTKVNNRKEKERKKKMRECPVPRKHLDKCLESKLFWLSGSCTPYLLLRQSRQPSNCSRKHLRKHRPCRAQTAWAWLRTLYLRCILHRYGISTHYRDVVPLPVIPWNTSLTDLSWETHQEFLVLGLLSKLLHN